jgi:hypothetical protein
MLVLQLVVKQGLNYVAEAGLQLTIPFVSQVLRLKTCTATSGHLSFLSVLSIIAYKAHFRNAGGPCFCFHHKGELKKSMDFVQIPGEIVLESCTTKSNEKSYSWFAGDPARPCCLENSSV